MANLSRVINELRRERERLSREVARLDNAIAALDYVGGSSNGRRAAGARRGRRPRRKLSAAARARIAAAQRARWAKVKARQARQEKKAA
jgi:hypothetical protein